MTTREWALDPKTLALLGISEIDCCLREIWVQDVEKLEREWSATGVALWERAAAMRDLVNRLAA